MADATPRLALDYIAPGQAQKELAHNEALAVLDALVLPAASGPRNAPPATPAVGDAFLVGSAPSGEWTSHAGAIACWTEGGWRFVVPAAGMQVMRLSGGAARFDGAAWADAPLAGSRVEVAGVKVVGTQVAAIAAPTGGSTADAQARTAIAGILAALRSHGLIAT